MVKGYIIDMEGLRSGCLIVKANEELHCLHMANNKCCQWQDIEIKEYIRILSILSFITNNKPKYFTS